MGTSGVPLDRNKIIDAIYSKKGIIKNAALIVPCDASSIYALMKIDPDVAFAVQDAREKREEYNRELAKEAGVRASEAIVDLIADGNPTAIIFTLKTQCGWVETPQQNTLSITLNKQPYEELQGPDDPLQIPM